MPVSESGRIGKRGTFVLPAKLRRRFGIVEGSDVIVEETPDGILIRPAITVPLEIYSPERRAEFILSNAVDSGDYLRAVAQVRAMGLEPEQVPHTRPSDV